MGFAVSRIKEAWQQKHLKYSDSKTWTERAKRKSNVVYRNVK